MGATLQNQELQQQGEQYLLGHSEDEELRLRKQAEELISKFQHGTEPYKVTLQIINSLSKIAPPSADIAGVQKADAQSQLAQMQKSGMQDMLQRNLSPGGGSAGGGAPSAGGPGPPAPAMPPALAA